MIFQVIRKIFRATWIVVFPMALSCILFIGPASTKALVKGWTPIEEDSSSLELNGEQSFSSLIDPSLDNQSNGKSIAGTNIKEHPDLGSDQVFPFIAGLDSFQ